MKKILIIAFEFPPCRSAGVQRTLAFCESLYDLGWAPIVLTANEKAYAQLDTKLQVKPEVLASVYRTFALDSSRHLSIKGKYLGSLEKPDKFISWYFFAVLKGKKIISQHKPDVIYSTYPISTAHMIANTLKKWSGLPWVADFRDPYGGHYSSSMEVNKRAMDVDRETVRNADRLVFTTNAAKMLYGEKFSNLSVGKSHVIENGYNEEMEGFCLNKARADVHAGKFVLLYSGALYPQGRDPVPLFEAISELLKGGEVSSETFLLRFRGPTDGDEFNNAISKLGLEGIVQFQGAVSYEDSVNEMFNASALLLLQGSVFNYQIPGKVYEYLAAERPILCCSGRLGATSELLKGFDHVFFASESSVTEIRSALLSLIKHKGIVNVESKSIYSRNSRAKELLGLISDLVSS